MSRSTDSSLSESPKRKSILKKKKSLISTKAAAAAAADAEARNRKVKFNSEDEVIELPEETDWRKDVWRPNWRQGGLRGRRILKGPLGGADEIKDEKITCKDRVFLCMCDCSCCFTCCDCMEGDDDEPSKGRTSNYSDSASLLSEEAPVAKDDAPKMRDASTNVSTRKYRVKSGAAKGKLFQSENRNPEVKKKPKSQEDDEDSISAAAAARAAPAAASASAPFLAPAAASSIFNGSFSASASFSVASATHSHPASSSPETSSTSSSAAFVGRSLSSDVLLSTATGSRRGSSSWPRFDDDDETSDRDADEAALMLGGAVGGEILPADFEMERFGCGGGGDVDDDDEVASVASTALAVVDGGAEGSGGAGSRGGGGGGAASDSQRLKSAKVFPSFLRYYSRHYQEMKEAETEVEEEEEEEEEEGKKVKGRRKKKGSKKKRQKGNLSGS